MKVEDLVPDDLYDDTEFWEYTVPQLGCPAFEDALYCESYFDETSNFLMGTEHGWNQAIGIIEFVPVDDAIKTGAMIQNLFS